MRCVSIFTWDYLLTTDYQRYVMHPSFRDEINIKTFQPFFSARFQAGNNVKQYISLPDFEEKTIRCASLFFLERSQSLTTYVSYCC